MEVSIIIPVFNVEKYLEECINSVIKQDLNKMEIIIINDGSTDKSLDIINYYHDNYKFITVINQENKGLSYSRNIGIEKANGKYIVFLDGDDYINSTCLSEFYYICEENDLDILAFDYIMYFEDEDIFENDKKNTLPYSKEIYNGENLFNLLFESDIEKGYAVVYMYKKSFLINNNLKFYNGILYEDGLFICKALIRANRTMYIPRDAYVYRIRANSIVNSVPTNLNVNSNIIIIDELMKFYKENEENLKDRTKINILTRILNVYKATIRLINMLDCEVSDCTYSKLAIKKCMHKIDLFIKSTKINGNTLDLHTRLEYLKRDI